MSEREGWGGNSRRLAYGFCVNPLMPKSDLYILLCLTPDYFTRQLRET